MNEEEKAEMRTVKTYDIECYELACHFLLDETGLDDEAHRKQLAVEIQQCVEDEIMYMRAHLKQVAHEVARMSIKERK